ncbi:hypothetical protein O3M35_012580 [Rhynocoris fuscipes]|uniref:Uncharacterized protein n=1 Tax=Rhynocoris fuscipes TaxID=488301 RepID=A0AAW1CZB9_9HEMI
MFSTQTIAAVLLLCISGAIGAVIQKREADVTTNEICRNRTPCAWAVYVPFTRKIEYFMKNTCVCEKGKICQRADDDISVSAYVYRCNAGTNNINSTTNNSSSSEVGNTATS